MKVLYLVSGVGPKAGWGTEFIQDLIVELSKKKVEATILNPIYIHTPRDWQKWSKELKQKYEVRIIPIIFPNWIKQSLILSLYLTPFIVTYQSIKLLRKERFDIIHEFSSTPVILLRSLIYKYIFQTPTIFTLSVFNNTLLGSFKWIKLFNFSEKYLIPSREIIETLKSYSIKQDKIIYSPPGLNLELIKNGLNKNNSRSLLKLPQDKFIVSFFGSLTEEKGVEDIITSTKYLDKELSDKLYLCFFTVWKGSTTHNNIKAMILDKKHKNIVLREEYTNIPKLLSASDLILLPQHSGHGATIPIISIIEAMKSGTPVIATDIIGTRELLNNKYNYLVPPKNPSKIAQAIKSAYYGGKKTNNDLLKKVTDKFNISKSVSLHLSVYKNLIKNAK